MRSKRLRTVEARSANERLPSTGNRDSLQNSSCILPGDAAALLQKEERRAEGPKNCRMQIGWLRRHTGERVFARYFACAEYGDCWSVEEGCHCDHWGEAVACKGVVSHFGSYVTCAGMRACEKGYWGPCVPPSYKRVPH